MRDEYPPLDPEQGRPWRAWAFLLMLVTFILVVIGYYVI
jgi:hypothetical protein